MKIISPEFWGRFINAKGKFDGFLFEDLVERLLNCAFGGNWEATPRTRDKGKDFCRALGGETHWAEAKLHKNKIQLKTVATTLVIAVAEEVNRVMIFSYSPLTKDARMHLGLFQESSGSKVSVFEDEALEALILDYIEEFEQFFDVDAIKGQIGESDTTSSPSIAVEYGVTKDLDCDFSHTRRKQRSQSATYVDRGAIVALDILVINHSTGERSVTVTPPESNSDFVLENANSLESELNFKLNPGEQKLLRLLYRAVSSANKARVAQALIVSDDSNQTIPELPFTISSFYTPQLVGEVFRQHRDKYTHFVSGRSNPTVATIEGPSGSGKTRLLETFAEQASLQGYHCHFPTARLQLADTHDAFIQSFVSKVFNLPILIEELEETESALRDSDVIGRLLYDRSFDINRHFQQIARLTALRLVKYPTLLVCDDVQRLSESAITFLFELLSCLETTSGMSGIVLVFNTSEIFINTHAADLLNILADKNDSLPQRYQTYSLDTFARSDAIDFVNAMIAPGRDERYTFTGTFPETTELMLDKIISRPLHLYHTFKYFEDIKALGRTHDRFYVKDINLLHAEMSTLPPELSKTFEKRWQIIDEKDSFFRTSMQLLCIFKEVAYLDFERLLIACSDNVDYKKVEEILHFLYEAGFLAEANGDYISFFHSQVANFFLEIYKRPSPELASICIQQIEGEGLQAAYYIPYVACLDRLGAFSQERIVDAVTKLASLGHDDQSEAFAEIVHRHLVRYPDVVEPGLYVESLRKLARHALKMKGFKTANAQMQHDYSLITEHLSLFENEGDQINLFAHEYVGSHIGLNNNSQADDILKDLTRINSKLHFSCPKEWLRWEGLRLNRRCVTAKSLIRRLDAAHYAKQSIRIAQQLNDPVLLFRNYIDWGYIFYGTHALSNRLIGFWEKATSCYDMHHARMKDDRGTAELMKARLQLLKGKPDKCAAMASETTRFCMDDRDAFHAIKGLLLQGVANLFSKTYPLDRQLVTQKILTTALDWCARYASNRSYWMVLYALAKHWLKVGDCAEALTFYSMAMEQLLKKPSVYKLRSSAYFFEDCAIIRRSEGKSFSTDELTQIVDTTIHARIIQIISCTDDEFRSIRTQPLWTSTLIADDLGSLPAI